MNRSQISYEEYLKLCDDIWSHNKRYYLDHQPTISDEEFDKLYSELKAIEIEHPEWADPSSPTQRVGEMLTEGFKTVAHKTPMLSLENSYSKNEIEDFVKRMDKLTELKDHVFSCELKMDGIAISVCYENGKFVRAVTRGDGKKGDDITNNVKAIESLPLKLQGDNIPTLLEIRGEVFMQNSVFEELNRQRSSLEAQLWANPRNAAAGTLKLLDPKEVYRRKLSIVFYAAAEESTISIKSQYDIHRYLQMCGLPTLSLTAQCHNIDEIWEFTRKVKEMRKQLPFNIDGVVIKLDNRVKQEQIGSTAKHPRWAIAYKFAAEQAVTVIKDITVQVGRSGILTPVAELEPVFLAGSTIARATLHNAEEIQRKDIRIGDTVYIEKGGDVIPKVVKVAIEKRPSHAMVWTMPLSCPICGSPVVQIPGEVAVRCTNRSNCSQQILRRLIHFAAKGAMDIENMGSKVVEKLVECGFVSRPSDIYKLTAEELFQLEGFKDKSVKNLLTSIERSKNVPLDRFIMALGIPHIGSGIALDLAEHTKSIKSLSTMTLEELTSIEGVGAKVAKSLVEYFTQQENIEEIQHLLDAGIVPISPESKLIVQGHLWNGKSFVLTGTLAKFTRSQATALINERGGKVIATVSKKTDFLVAGEEAGSKLEKAKALSVTILSEDEFTALL